MKDPRDKQFAADLQHEGRDKAYIDVDRMINEGMGGGHVFRAESMSNIEESLDLYPEDPPNE